MSAPNPTLEPSVAGARVSRASPSPAEMSSADGVVVETLARGDGALHVVHTSAQMGVFLSFAIAWLLSAWAETLHARAARAAGKRGADAGELADLPASVAPGAASDPDAPGSRPAPVPRAAAPAGASETAASDDASSARDAELGGRSPDPDPAAPASPPSVVTNPLDPRQLAALPPARLLAGDRAALMRSRLTLRAWAELGVILAMFYFADRAGAVPDAEKSYDRDVFLFLFFALVGCGYYATLTRSKQPFSPPLNREQTEEWKGWMQVLFLLYHYFKASEMYNAIRLFIAAYVWMTGFGNFSYYYVRRDFSAPRFAQMMWRLNFFVFFCCVVMRNDYVLYYICPMHTLFTLFVYFALLARKEDNDKTPVVLGKFLACAALCFVLWEVPGVFGVVFAPFRFLLGYVDPARPDVDPMHEWFFRSGLDRYVWIHGMACAYCHPRYEAALRWLDEQCPPAQRVAMQCLVGAATLGVSWWYYHAYYVLPKLEYNAVHPYTSWIPITCFIVLRNLTKSLRAKHVALFCWCGKITLETYISQFHVWLSTANVPNGQPSKLMALVPGYPMVNFGISTIVYVGVSQRVFAITNELKLACVPNDPKVIAAHAVVAAAWGAAFTVAGFLVVHVLMLEPVFGKGG